MLVPITLIGVVVVLVLLCLRLTIALREARRLIGEVRSMPSAESDVHESELLSRMSHELRTPLNAILGFGQLLESDRSTSELQHENAVRIVTAGRHLLGLIDEVLHVTGAREQRQDDIAVVVERHRGPTRKILAVEDNAISMRLLEALMATDTRFELLRAYDGTSCLRLVAEQRPDVVLLDLELGDISGADVLRRLQADPETAGIPVVIITAEADFEHARKLLQAGARAYLSKPLDIGEFFRTIDAVTDLDPRHCTIGPTRSDRATPCGS